MLKKIKDFIKRGHNVWYLLIVGIVLIAVTVGIVISERKANEAIEWEKIKYQEDMKYKAWVNQQPAPTIFENSPTNMGTKTEQVLKLLVLNADTITINNTPYVINSGEVQYMVKARDSDETVIINVVGKNKYKSTQKTIIMTREVPEKEDIPEEIEEDIPDWTEKLGAYAQNEDNLLDVVTVCQTLVKEELLSPSSAEFPRSLKEWATAPATENVLLAESYVDFDNAFGVTIRSKFICVLKIENSEILNGAIQRPK